MYHPTKWALEGWSEATPFELNQFGIGLKIIEPGSMKTDFFTRSFDVGRHPDYDTLVARVMERLPIRNNSAPIRLPSKSPKWCTGAATDGTDQLRYVAGADAKATYAMRLKLGDEAFRKVITEQFVGQSAPAMGEPIVLYGDAGPDERSVNNCFPNTG